MKITVETSQYDPSEAFRRAIAKYENSEDVETGFVVALVGVLFHRCSDDDDSHFEWNFEIST